MAEFTKKTSSSTAAKAGLGFGIAGTALGLLNSAGGLAGASILNRGIGEVHPVSCGMPYVFPSASIAQPVVTSVPMMPMAPAAPVVVAPEAGGCCGGGYVTNREMQLIRESSEKDSKIAKLESEKYTVEYVNASLAPVYGQLNALKQENCDLKATLAMESERRSCGDENLFTYVNGTFVPAMKSIDSRDINYHGVRPVLRPACCCNHHHESGQGNQQAAYTGTEN